jgi:signal transduction histidine kinase
MGMLVEDVVKSVSTEAESRKASVYVDTKQDLPPVLVDPMHIREVLANLIANALHHTPPGGVISISATLASERLLLTVTDTGSGIAAEDLPHIFERFYKGPRPAVRDSALPLRAIW